MKKYALSLFMCFCVLVSAAASNTVLAADTLHVTDLHASANGWNSNTNWVGFQLDRSLDLSKPNADVVIYYEYVDKDGNLQQMVYTKTAIPYVKSKLFTGYLVDVATGKKYGSGNGEEPSYSDVIPANTLICTSLVNASTVFPELTAKVAGGDVKYFRMKLIVCDENGEVVCDDYTNWVEYGSDLTTSAPRGVDRIPDGFVDPLKDLPVLSALADKETVIAATGITAEKTKVTLELNQRAQLAATLTPVYANEDIAWKSSNPNIVKVSNTGEITAVSEGVTTITASVSGGEVKFAVTVPAKAKAPDTAEDTKIKPAETGDTLNATAWAGAIVLAGAALLFTLKHKRRDSQ